MVIIYFESSALFKAYFPEKGSKNVEYALSLLGNEVIGATSQWTLLEIVRGFVKRKNLGEITDEELYDIIGFFLHDIERMVIENQIKLVEIRKDTILKALDLIKQYNLYAADALHMKTAEIIEARAILVDDYHYEKMKNATKLEVLNVDATEDIFKRKLGKILERL